jgi:hypothetical protein
MVSLLHHLSLELVDSEQLVVVSLTTIKLLIVVIHRHCIF